MRGTFSHELVYASHLAPDISVVKQFQTVEEAEDYLLAIYSRLPVYEQVNYWIRPLEIES